MPTVPSYATPQVAARGPGNGILDTTHASPDAFGAAVGRGLQGVGQGIDTATNVAADIMHRNDVNEVMNAENMLGEIEQARLHDPNSGYFSTRGMQASGGAKSILEDYTKQGDAIRKSLKSEAQQVAFDRIFAKRKLAVAEAASRHESAQTRQATLDTANALVMNSINGAAANYTDPKSINFHMVNGTRAIMTASAMNGESQEVTSQKVAEFTSKSHAAILSRMMLDSPMAAKDYYDQHKEQIDGTTRLDIERSLRGNVDKDEARRSAEGIFATGGSLADMLAEARKIDNTEVSDQAVTRIKTMYEEQNAAKTQLEERVWQSLVQNPTYDAIPVELDGTTQVKMRDYVEQRLTKGLITTNPTTYRDLLTMASNNPEDFISVSLPSLATELDKSSMDYLKSLQDDIKKSGAMAVSGIRTQQEMVKGQLKGMGIKEDKPKGQQFFIRAQDEAAQFQKENNRQPNATEFQGILDRLSTVTVDGWTSDSRMYELKVDGVPTQYVDDIAESLTKKGKPVTEHTIRQTYLLAKEKGLLDAPRGTVPASSPTKIGPQSNIPDALINAVNVASAKTGEDGDLLLRIAGAESSYGKYQSNPNSSAKGYFHIIGGTWDDIRDRLGADISDPNNLEHQAIAAATYLKDLRSQIKDVAGKNPSDTDMYVAWFAGAGGARNILGALKNGDGHQKVTDYLSRDQVAANRAMLYSKYGRPLTVSQFYEIMSNKVA